MIAVDDAKEDLLPNTSVMVTVTVQQHSHVLTIPRTALHTEGPVNYVLLVKDGTLHKTIVDTGVVNLERAEITRGLAENDLVAVSAADNRELRDGMRVRLGDPPSSRPGIVASLKRRVLSAVP